MVEGDFGFCQHCGAKVGQGTVICPYCGQCVTGSFTEVQDQSYIVNRGRSITLTWMCILILAYAVTSLINLTAVLSADTYISVYKSLCTESQWALILSSNGMTTDSEFAAYLVNIGIVASVSGALAFVSGVLVLLRRYHKVSVIFCVVASLVLFAIVLFSNGTNIVSNLLSAILQCLIGLMIARILYRCGPEFRD